MEDKSFKNNSAKKKKARQILNRLQSEFHIETPEKGDPFLVLIRTVLSQNTNRKNTEKAYEKLVPRYKTPEDFLKAGQEKIKELIKPAGLYRNKSKNLIKISKEITENQEKNLEKILKKNPEEARKELLELPGVGPKTADCVLLFADGRDVTPVDTHVARISKRLGFTDPNSNPEQVKEDLEQLLPEGRRGKAHLLLIELGRTYCTARNPNCKECPVENLCPKKGLE